MSTKESVASSKWSKVFNSQLRNEKQNVGKKVICVKGKVSCQSCGGCKGPKSYDGCQIGLFETVALKGWCFQGLPWLSTRSCVETN